MEKVRIKLIPITFTWNCPECKTVFVERRYSLPPNSVCIQCLSCKQIFEVEYILEEGAIY